MGGLLCRPEEDSRGWGHANRTGALCEKAQQLPTQGHAGEQHPAECSGLSDLPAFEKDCSPGVEDGL